MAKKVLFICTGNASRSQMAEGLTNHDFGGRIAARSAGTDPKGVGKLAIMVMAEIGIDISHHTSDHLDKYQAEQFDYVITLCDNADRNCPIFFNKGKKTHLGFPDTPHTNEPLAENLAIYRQVRDAIRQTLKDFFNTELNSER